MANVFLDELYMDNSVSDFWKGILPQQGAEKEAVYWHGQRGVQHFNYKDLQAKAHCVAAFLISRGHQAGDPVLAIHDRGPDYLFLDWGLQMAGAHQVCLPPAVTEPEVNALVRRESIRFVFLGNQDIFQALNELEAIREELTGLHPNATEIEARHADKIVTFDRVIEQGKIAWREDAPGLQSRKAAVQGAQPYTSFGLDAGRRLRMSELIQASAKAEELLGPAPATALVCLEPHHVQLRTFGTYAPLRAGHKLHYCLPDQLSPDMFRQVQPAHIVLSSQDLNQLFHQLPNWLGKGADATMTKALEILGKKMDAEAGGGKQPFMNRLRYNSTNKKLYKSIRKVLGGKLQGFVLNDTDLEPAVRLIFDEIGIQLHT